MNKDSLQFKLHKLVKIQYGLVILSEDITVELFGYKRGKSTMNYIHKYLTRHYIIDTDYKIHDTTYLISMNCLLQLMMRNKKNLPNDNNLF